jgi:23S rRNA (pseudouridine1915-N3)-methyltransferase
MFRITIVAVGKMYEPSMKEAQELFLTRLSPYAKISIEEVATEVLGSTVSGEEVLRREGERLLKRIPDGATVVLLEKEGAQRDSVAFAKFVEELAGNGAHVVFVIGGSLGVSADVRARASQKISFSKMTFTHEMARVFLLEQLYRSAMILRGKPYHK